MLVCAACPVSVAVRPVCLGSRDLQGTRDTTPVSCIGFAACQRCTAPYLASMKVLVSTANNIEGDYPSPLGRRMTRVLIRDGDNSANGVAPVAVRDGATGDLAVLELRRASPPGE